MWLYTQYRLIALTNRFITILIDQGKSTSKVQNRRRSRTKMYSHKKKVHPPTRNEKIFLLSFLFWEIDVALERSSNISKNFCTLYELFCVVVKLASSQNLKYVKWLFDYTHKSTRHLTTWAQYLTLFRLDLLEVICVWGKYRVNFSFIAQV